MDACPLLWRISSNSAVFAVGHWHEDCNHLIMKNNFTQKFQANVHLRPEAVIAWANLELLSLKSEQNRAARSKIAESLIELSKALEKNPWLRKTLQSLVH